MMRSEVLAQLRKHLPEIRERFGVVDLVLFGSTSRDSASTDSDVDILVTFKGPATSGQYFGLLFYLEDMLGVPVDLVTDKALRSELRPYIEKEAVHI